MSNSTSSAEVDYLDLCEKNVHNIEALVKKGNLLNQRQCEDLLSKISQTTQNIRELSSYCRTSAGLFGPALHNLYRNLEKASVLVSNCAEEDWCAAAVFQCQNENAFRELLLDLGLCYNAIYDHAKSTRENWNDPPSNLRQDSEVFHRATDTKVHDDQEDLKKRLDDIANGYAQSRWFDSGIRGRVARRQSLAKYLLEKMCYTPLQSQLDTYTYSAILWREVSEPSGTWGSSRFLGAGSGASGVCRNTLIGIPCAKKEFHGRESETCLMKEVRILADLKHPNIVSMICCGNGLARGDRFIAMELMERSLFDLIQEQKGVPFPLSVAVDMMVQMARGVRYLHERGVAHRDLKPQNVVVNRLSLRHVENHFGVKSVDSGISKVKVEASKSNTMSHSGIGTTMYRAPEAHPTANHRAKVKWFKPEEFSYAMTCAHALSPKVEASKSNTMSYSGIGTTMYRAPEAHPTANPGGGAMVNWFKADAFSFAMTCAHVLSLKVPFNDLSPSELYKEVCKNARRPDLRDMCPEELILLLKDCWKSNPLSRPSFVEICTRLERLKYNDQVVDRTKWTLVWVWTI